MLAFLHGQHGALLATPMGFWYLLEVVGFVLVPCILFTLAVRNRNERFTQIAAVLALLGIVLNRLNISVIAFKWYAAVRYVPTWMEVVVTLAVILSEIWVFRWIVNRMPVVSESPEWAREQDATEAAAAPAVPYRPAVKEA
jgi:Ni/Fe-hydrogenase subunit HybB-like protein